MCLAINLLQVRRAPLPPLTGGDPHPVNAGNNRVLENPTAGPSGAARLYIKQLWKRGYQLQKIKGRRVKKK